MSENHESTEPVEAIEISDEDIAGFIEHHGGEMPTYHPILHIWRTVLEPAVAEQDAHITPQWANRITSSYRELNFADMVAYQRSYYAKVLRLLELLNEVIASDDDCLTYTSPEEDVEHNAKHYKALLFSWQLEMLGWELDWNCSSETAAVDIAAISEVHKMFFGPTGLTAFLDNIKFEFTEDDQQELAAALQELKEGR